MTEGRVDPDSYVCAVCGYVLDEQDGQYMHAAATGDLPHVADHPVVPVRAGEVPGEHIRTQCDFCVEEDPQWIVPARDFLNPGSLTGSRGSWAACDECAALIGRNDWNGVIRRALEGFHVRHGESMRPAEQTLLRAMYRQLRKNMTGSVYKIEEEKR